MKYFKRIDFFLQLLLIAGALAHYGFYREMNLYGYFVVGAWQFSSFLIHIGAAGHFYQSHHRKYYGWALMGLALLGLAMIPAFLYYLIGVLFITPLYACWYAWICYRENVWIRRRELIHLK